MKVLKKRKERKAARPTPLSTPTPTHVGEERVKTTLAVKNHVYLRSKEMARQLGLTFNAYMTTLMVDDYQRRTNGFPAAHPPTAPSVPVQPVAPVIHIVPQSGARRPRVDPLERFLERHPSFESKTNPDDRTEAPLSCDWDDVWQYVQAVKQNDQTMKIHEMNSHDAAMKLEKLTKRRWDGPTVAACQMASELSEYDQYVNARKKHDELVEAGELEG